VQSTTAPARHVSGDVLSANLSVDLIDLHMSSDHLVMHQHELRAAHAAADSVMADAQAKWVGASASAIRTALTRWREDTDALIGEITAQANNIRCAAHELALTDSDGANAIDSRRPWR
jgi:uncharacterized protein YukE